MAQPAANLLHIFRYVFVDAASRHGDVAGMYPLIRSLSEVVKGRRAAPLGLYETHVSHHICWPWDIDLWMELNNGRTLTLFDLGRISMAERNGFSRALRKGRFGLVVAGASVRYRKRITSFERIEMRTKPVGFDERFFYVVQEMWKRDGTCANQVLIRGAVTKKGKMVPPSQLLDLIDPDAEPRALPEWVAAWAEADSKRPWPPEPI